MFGTPPTRPKTAVTHAVARTTPADHVDVVTAPVEHVDVMTALVDVSPPRVVRAASAAARPKTAHIPSGLETLPIGDEDDELGIYDDTDAPVDVMDVMGGVGGVDVMGGVGGVSPPVPSHPGQTNLHTPSPATSPKGHGAAVRFGG